jgi:hypothetical protein
MVEGDILVSFFGREGIGKLRGRFDLCRLLVRGRMMFLNLLLQRVRHYLVDVSIEVPRVVTFEYLFVTTEANI